jgi:hypothetical protein
MPRKIGDVAIFASDNKAGGDQALGIIICGTGSAKGFGIPTKSIQVGEAAALGTEVPEWESDNGDCDNFALSLLRLFPRLWSAEFRNGKLALKAWLVNHIHPIGTPEVLTGNHA